MTTPASQIDNVLSGVRRETLRQVELWGEQNHPDGTSPDMQWATIIYPLADTPAQRLADSVRAKVDMLAQVNELCYADILLEEVCEAFAESDKEKLREELIQVAAVAVNWVAKIDRGM